MNRGWDTKFKITNFELIVFDFTFYLKGQFLGNTFENNFKNCQSNLIISTFHLIMKQPNTFYSNIGSRIVKSPTYCNQILNIPLYLSRTQNPPTDSCSHSVIIITFELAQAILISGDATVQPNLFYKLA